MIILRYKQKPTPGAVLEFGTCFTENEHAATKPQDDMPYEFYSLLSATHGNRAVKILANSYGLTITFGTNSVRTIGSQCICDRNEIDILHIAAKVSECKHFFAILFS